MADRARQPISWEKYDVVYPLEFQIPQSLLSTPETLIGCEDCVDWSGIYIQTFHDGQKRHWYITAGYEDPEIKAFAELVLNKIAEIE